MQIDYMTGSYRGKVIFWQFDIAGKIHTGKVMDYDPKSGHNTGYFNWFHKWNKNVEKELGREFVLKQCLYGEHLLGPNPTRPVALVEAYKTAHVGAILMPWMVWVAVDSMSGLTAERLRPLKGRDVVLFPDEGKGYEVWRQKIEDISHAVGFDYCISAFMEGREHGADIADVAVAGE